MRWLTRVSVTLSFEDARQEVALCSIFVFAPFFRRASSKDMIGQCDIFCKLGKTYDGELYKYLGSVVAGYHFT